MNINKINPWLAGSAMIFAGSFLIYFEYYRNSEFIDGISFLLILLGWVTLFQQATKDTAVSAPKILYKQDKAEWLRQRSFIILAYLILIALLGGNIFYFHKLGFERQRSILETQPTAKTIAAITAIQTRKGRNSTSYYAVFQYTVAGKVIQHPWYERHKNDFLVGQQFMIQYSVQYPEMFKIIKTLPPVF